MIGRGRASGDEVEFMSLEFAGEHPRDRTSVHRLYLHKESDNCANMQPMAVEYFCDSAGRQDRSG